MSLLRGYEHHLEDGVLDLLGVVIREHAVTTCCKGTGYPKIFLKEFGGGQGATWFLTIANICRCLFPFPCSARFQVLSIFQSGIGCLSIGAQMDLDSANGQPA